MQAWDRYAYSNNNSVRFTDSTGHSVNCAANDYACQAQVKTERGGTPSDLTNIFSEEENEDKPLAPNPDPPFDNSLGGFNKEAETSSQESLPSDNAGEDGVNWGAAIVGAGLIIVGGVIFFAGASATAIALSDLQVELVPLTAIVAVAGGLIAYGGIRALTNSGLIPGTERNR